MTTDYLMLMRNHPSAMERLSPAELQTHLERWGAWMGGLAKANRLRGGKPLAQGAATVRGTVVTDGPYVEVKDVVGGYVIVACESLAEAAQTAKGCPVIDLGGSVEVRETAPNVLVT